MQSDIASVRLPMQVDVIFSNAVLHWIADHGKVFANFAGLLKDGGDLIAQCGGQGNLENALAGLSVEPVVFDSREQFSAYVKTVVIRPHLARLPAQLQDRFLEEYLDRCEERPQKWLLDYVRLNITAEK